jgi:hypothetical protein
MNSRELAEKPTRSHVCQYRIRYKLFSREQTFSAIDVYVRTIESIVKTRYTLTHARPTCNDTASYVTFMRNNLMCLKFVDSKKLRFSHFPLQPTLVQCKRCPVSDIIRLTIILLTFSFSKPGHIFKPYT